MISGKVQTTFPGLLQLQNLIRARGWPYLISWAHRVSGIFLAVYLLFHVLTLSSLQTPEKFIEKMNLYTAMFPGFFDWFLAIPVIFHALNGGRLILYEIFGHRNDTALFKSALLISVLYLLLLASFMIMGNQSVSPFFFWSQFSAASFCLAIVTAIRMKHSRTSVFWKLQRVTAVFLFTMIPAHMLFMHLDPAIGRDVQIITARMGSGFIKGIDIGLGICALYHGAYGLIGIVLDYMADGKLRFFCSTAIIFVFTFLAFLGIKMTISI
ncbi:MAG: hypothetical protein V2I35_06725 [Desulfocapsaceae bacterium]|jgi:succinate dehydrogenase cytochrome b556 subunit|nr:hypothetical protein [Desulfocapsaceae bacterium]